MSIKLPVTGGDGASYLKASKDITNVPRQFRIWKDPEYVRASDPKFGNEEGMQYKYFLEEKGTQYTMNSTSARLAFAFNAADLTSGDTIAISKTGTGFDTKYIVTKVKSGNPLMDENEFPEALMHP